MNFKPSNFYIGTIALFAILLPGVIATLMVYQIFYVDLAKVLSIPKGYINFYYTFFFLLFSYLLGQIISQLGSYLDDWLYDSLKEIIVKDYQSLQLIEKIRSKYHNVEEAEKYINNFDWARSRLLKELPEAVTEIERHIADSKFFRGLFLILLLLSGWLAVKAYWDFAALSLLIAVFSVVTYFHKRKKATETAYQYIIFLENTYPDGSDEEKDIDKTIKKPPDQYLEFIKSLIIGFNAEYIYREIAPQTQWQANSPLPKPEIVYCLAGKGMLYPSHNQIKPSNLTSVCGDACITIPAGKSPMINNLTNEILSLVFIAVK